MADDALARWDGGREAMLNGVPGFVLRDRRIWRPRLTHVAGVGIGAGVDRRAIVGLNDLTGAAAARAIIAWMIVGAEKVKRGVEETGLLCSEHGGIRSVLSAQAARAEASTRAAGFLQALGNAHFTSEASASLKDAKDVARLGD